MGSVDLYVDYVSLPSLRSIISKDMRARGNNARGVEFITTLLRGATPLPSHNVLGGLSHAPLSVVDEREVFLNLLMYSCYREKKCLNIQPFHGRCYVK